MSKRLFSILLFLFYWLHCNKANSQSNNFLADIQIISAKKITGKWYPTDTNATTIQFVDSTAGFMLTGSAVNHPYYLSKDSLGNISSSGYYPMWPPPSCYLSLIADDTLKVNYFNSMDEGVNFFYTRKKSLNKK